MALTISIIRKAVDLSLLFSLGFKHELGKNEGVKNLVKNSPLISSKRVIDPVKKM